MQTMVGTILSIERCSLHDGPGLRTTVFLKGCPLKCLWCHNPESLSFKPELYYFEERCTQCGKCGDMCSAHTFDQNTHQINRQNCNACGKCVTACPNAAFEIKGCLQTVQEVMDIVEKDKRFYDNSGGGLTISGGEPFSQFNFTLELLKQAKNAGIHTCIETSGQTSTENILAVVPFTDLFLFDFKESDDTRHKEYTGLSQAQILKNLHAVNNADAKIILRCPIIPGCNNRTEHFATISKLANELNNIIAVNIMPYHPMGASKATRIGVEYKIDNATFPTEEEITNWLSEVQSRTTTTVERG